jgi:hypothetical protein
MAVLDTGPIDNRASQVQNNWSFGFQTEEETPP